MADLSRLILVFALSLIAAGVCSRAAAQTGPAPEAITDPAKISSKTDAEVEQAQQSLALERLYAMRTVGRTTWSPDGRTVAFVSNLGGRENLWLVPEKGGWPTELTVSDQRQENPTWSPSGKWIAYMSDYDGDEQWDIFLVSPQTGQTVNLTHTREIAEQDPHWSRDGRYLAYRVKPKSSPASEIDVYDTVLREVKHLTSGTAADLTNIDPIWSYDGKWIAYSREQAKGTDSNIFLVEVSSGRSTLLTPHLGEEHYRACDFSPDGNRLLITSDARNGSDNAALLELSSGKISWLTNEIWPVAAGKFSPDGRWVSWTMNRDGNVDVYLHDLRSRQTTPLPAAKGVNTLGGSESCFSADGSLLLYYQSGPTRPNDAWVYSLAERKAHPVTSSLVAGVRSKDMVEPLLVHYPSRDGHWTISAFVYVPFNMPRNGQNAAIVFVHGGPASQSLNGFDRFIQHMANQGYIVIAPNYRGSSGYGKRFQQANLFDRGGGDLEDLFSASDWIKQSGYLDPKKIVLMGRSYGGYLTMMGVAKAPDAWAAGVAIVPFVNWFTEIEAEDPVLREIDIATMGDPQKNQALYHDRSPIFRADQIKAPLLLLAGGTDPRCPKSEVLQAVAAVKQRGGVAEYKVYEKEGHAFARLEDQIDAFERVAGFVKAHVPPAKCGCSLAE
jgi:dipeptidyl aminopeptidase/acylaminoacyl peptidase